MKDKKHSSNGRRGKAAFLSLLMLGIPVKTVLFNGCEKPVGPEKPCPCTDKEHLGVGEKCGCGGTGCECGLKVYGHIKDIPRNRDIPVYREGDISEEKMLDVIKTAQGAYDSTNISGDQRDALMLGIGKWLAVYITTGSGTDSTTIGEDLDLPDRRYILEFGEDAEQDWMRGQMHILANAIINGTAQIRPANGVRMAVAPAAKQPKLDKLVIHNRNRMTKLAYRQC